MDLFIFKSHNAKKNKKKLDHQRVSVSTCQLPDLLTTKPRSSSMSPLWHAPIYVLVRAWRNTRASCTRLPKTVTGFRGHCLHSKGTFWDSRQFAHADCLGHPVQGIGYDAHLTALSTQTDTVVNQRRQKVYRWEKPCRFTAWWGKLAAFQGCNVSIERDSN